MDTQDFNKITAKNVNILFLCIHNAGRSQIAAAIANHLGKGNLNVYMGGSEPAEMINPLVVQVMEEININIKHSTPRPWTSEMLKIADIVITMGCGDSCPIYPHTKYIDWKVSDPHGEPIEIIRKIRDDIYIKVEEILVELGVISE